MRGNRFLLLFRQPKIVGLVIGVAVLLAIALSVWVIRIRSTVSQQQERLTSARSVPVISNDIPIRNDTEAAYYGHCQNVRGLARYAGGFYAATSGGLVTFGQDGTVLSHVTRANGLPDNDLTAVAVFRDRLYIGTSGHGVLTTDGRKFTHFEFSHSGAGHVTALAATEDRLMIGLMEGGVLEYDGTQFRRAGASHLASSPDRVTVILPRYPEMFVGTFDSGLYIWREGRWERKTMKDGLPSDRVTSLLGETDSILVGTDLGIARVQRDRIVPVAEVGNVTSLITFDGESYAGLFTGQILQIPKTPSRSRVQRPIGQLGLPNAVTDIALKVQDDRLWALTTHGIYVTEDPGTVPFKRFDQPGTRFQPSASHISALATDWRGRLWIGYFDRGIDVMDPVQPRLITHVEDEAVREINDIESDPDRRRMLVATSSGLVILDEQMRSRRITEQQGLISNSVSQVTLVPAHLVVPAANDRASLEPALVLATGGGLSVVVESTIRSLNAFHGLASNHLYAGAVVGTRLYLGTLNGLNVLDGLRVVQTYQTSNSRLSHNWVSALAISGGTVYIGSYGGGVDALLPTGELVNYAPLIGRFSVNPNSMHMDGDRLYVGTLDQGCWVLDLTHETWSRLVRGLGSDNVTAITADARSIYIGTDRGLTMIAK